MLSVPGVHTSEILCEQKLVTPVETHSINDK